MRQCVFLAQAVISISHEFARKLFEKHVLISIMTFSSFI